MLVVSDVMTRSVVTLTPGTPLQEAALTLANMGVSGAPVCDEQGRVIGVFSKSDIASKLSEDRPLETVTVGELMTSIVFSVRPENPLRTAIWLMVYENVHRVMVTDEGEQIVGIVTPMDVLKAIVAGKMTSAALADNDPKGA
jgi:predicted transcriptional regulator